MDYSKVKQIKVNYNWHGEWEAGKIYDVVRFHEGTGIFNPDCFVVTYPSGNQGMVAVSYLKRRMQDKDCFYLEIVRRPLETKLDYEIDDLETMGFR